MQIRHRAQLTTEEYADEVLARGEGLFHSRETRDAVYNLLFKQLQPKHHYTLRRRSIRNQQLHPEYVTDYVGQLETGFGNTQYRMSWSHLYTIDVGR